jgi:AraC-like DNA-binding protein
MQDLFKFSIINITEELSGEFGSGYGIDLLNENGIAVILNLNSDKDYTYIRNLVLRAKEFFSHNFKFTLTAGIGTIYEDIRLIKNSFAEASRAANYRISIGSDSVILYSELTERGARLKYSYPAELEMDLITAVKHGRVGEIEPIIALIRQTIVSQDIPPENVQFICSGLTNTMLKLVKDSGLEVHSEQDKALTELVAEDFETLAIFEARLIAFCRRVCASIENSRESKNFMLRDRILKYVTDHYTDSNLSLNSIADLFEVTPSYLTRYFKDQTGNPLMQYLDSVRMGKVKEQLGSSDLKLKEIIARNGYVDETNFIRKFKKNEGITPLQYRNLKRGVGSSHSPELVDN